MAIHPSAVAAISAAGPLGKTTIQSSNQNNGVADVLNLDLHALDVRGPLVRWSMRCSLLAHCPMLVLRWAFRATCGINSGCWGRVPYH